MRMWTKSECPEKAWKVTAKYATFSYENISLILVGIESGLPWWEENCLAHHLRYDKPNLYQSEFLGFRFVPHGFQGKCKDDMASKIIVAPEPVVYAQRLVLPAQPAAQRAGNLPLHSLASKALLKFCFQDIPPPLPSWVTADFRNWESCRTMPLICMFSRRSPVYPALTFWRCSILTPISPSPALKTSLSRATKISQPRGLVCPTHFKKPAIRSKSCARRVSLWIGATPALVARGAVKYVAAASSRKGSKSNNSGKDTDSNFPPSRYPASAHARLLANGAGERWPGEYCGGSLVTGPGHGGVVVRLLASHQGEPGSIPGGVTHGNRSGGCRWSAGFLVNLPLPPPLHSGAAPYSLRFILTGFQDLDVKSRPYLLTHLHSLKCCNLICFFGRSMAALGNPFCSLCKFYYFQDIALPLTSHNHLENTRLIGFTSSSANWEVGGASLFSPPCLTRRPAREKITIVTCPMAIVTHTSRAVPFPTPDPSLRPQFSHHHLVQLKISSSKKKKFSWELLLRRAHKKYISSRSSMRSPIPLKRPTDSEVIRNGASSLGIEERGMNGPWSEVWNDSNIRHGNLTRVLLNASPIRHSSVARRLNTPLTVRYPPTLGQALKIESVHKQLVPHYNQEATFHLAFLYCTCVVNMTVLRPNAGVFSPSSTCSFTPSSAEKRRGIRETVLFRHVTCDPGLNMPPGHHQRGESFYICCTPAPFMAF
ncbi:hypothetical protein PR048_015781 [Dryococelus australis]|uniref:Uncharacterized protein n=1 Tax=Dryococelus australis TaxID=614101 RepID=A0ABQ9HIF3_9NEOP|nr:hypothetical protein PR048_015781 [Dryococelus australis]